MWLNLANVIFVNYRAFQKWPHQTQLENPIETDNFLADFPRPNYSSNFYLSIWSVIACQMFWYFWYSRQPPPVSSPYSVPVTKDGVSSKNTMLRPSYPGGVPYPPRPGEQTPLRYIFPGAPGAPPPPQSPYSARDGVYGRPPQVNIVFSGKLNCSNKKCLKLQICKSFDLSALHAHLTISLRVLLLKDFW